MSKVTFASLNGTPTLEAKEISVPEWGGGMFRLEQMSAATYAALEKDFVKRFGRGWRENGLNGTESTVALIARCLTDEDGQRASEEWLMSQPMSVIERLATLIREVNGLSERAVEELEKNSTPGDAASSDSPTSSDTPIQT